MPEAFKLVTAGEKLVMAIDPGSTMLEGARAVLGGSASNTTGGMKKLPSPTRATQVNVTVALDAVVAPKYVLVPEMVTYPAGSPPVQVMVTLGVDGRVCSRSGFAAHAQVLWALTFCALRRYPPWERVDSSS